jgi:hypothetical protein
LHKNGNADKVIDGKLLEERPLETLSVIVRMILKWT